MGWNEFAEEKLVNCNWCSENTTIEDIRLFDLGTEIIKVCSGCYEDLKSEFGIIGESNYFLGD